MGRKRGHPIKKDRTWHLERDVNFDTLAAKFQKKVYGGLKGKIRLAVLNKDLAEFSPRSMAPAKGEPLKILDAGCGAAPFSLNFLEYGHDLVLCDISEKMLDLARGRARNVCDAMGVPMPPFLHGPIQELDLPTGFDLILCHAVVEWVVDPRVMIRHLLDRLAPGGIFSLTFYNFHGMVFKNLLRGNYKKILKKEYHGWPGSLTPAHPRKLDEVMGWVENMPLSLVGHSGMRVFHDYNLDMARRDDHPDTVVDLELEFSRKEPYRSMGRYQHLVFKKDLLCGK